MTEQYIVLKGSPFYGFTHYGVFDSFDNAEKWADETIGNEVEYWIAKLEQTTKETA